MSLPVFIFVGHSNAGKTTFVEKLIPELIRSGKRVATIKHAHHKVELDTDGKDSWRYKRAGATMSMLVTASALQLVVDAGERTEPCELAERFLGEADVVFAEGFSQARGPKIEVLRRAQGKGPRCAAGNELIALVTDCPEIYPELPHFGLEDAVGVAQFLLRQIQREMSGRPSGLSV
jgi:molybdopterin-guanine dinucleotide biosynthesis protein B